MRMMFLLIILLAADLSQAQYSLRASMGIDFASTPSLNDYINQNFPVDGSPLNDFNTAVNFSGELGYLVNEKFQLGLEIGYLLNSYNFSNELGKFELSYNFIAPSLHGYFVVAGEGYNFKFGGGAGIRILNTDLSFPGTTVVNNYSSTGFGVMIRVEGNTLLSGNFYANIGADLKYDIADSPISNGMHLHNNLSKDDVNFNSLSAGLRLGISYIF